MLKALFGSKDKEYVLQYLLSSQNGYARKIALFLELNVSQINKQLLALKQDGILISNQYGKTLVYELSNDCTFIIELKALLLKARENYDMPLQRRWKTLSKIPSKTRVRKATTGYYSGTIALNLFPDDSNGDWHSAIAKNALSDGKSKSPYFIMGKQGHLSTKRYFKDNGIVDISSTLKSMHNKPGITKAAKPYRAVADMVMSSLLRGKKTDHIQVNDWLVTPSEINKFIELFNSSSTRMNHIENEKVNAWIKHNL
jgi:hypothetical protein